MKTQFFLLLSGSYLEYIYEICWILTKLHFVTNKTNNQYYIVDICLYYIKKKNAYIFLIYL